jgi:hypothetical protein
MSKGFDPIAEDPPPELQHPASMAQVTTGSHGER